MSESRAAKPEFDHCPLMAAIAWGARFADARNIALPCA